MSQTLLRGSRAVAGPARNIAGVTLGLLAWDLERQASRGFSRGLLLVLAVTVAGNVLTSVPGLSLLRDYGLATGAGLLLWMTAIIALKDHKKGSIPTWSRACLSGE